MTADAPKSGDQQTPVQRTGGLTPDFGLGISLESMFLLVGAAKEPKSESEQENNRRSSNGMQCFRRVNQPPADQTIEKRHQHIVAPNQHPAKTLADHVPRVNHPLFKLEVAEHVNEGKGLIKDHCQSQFTIGFVLDHGK